MQSRVRNQRFARIAWGILFLTPLLAYLSIAVSTGRTFLHEDGLLYSFPMRAFLHNAFVQDFSPQWMPYSACGFSLLAEGQSGVCFPAAQVIYRLFDAGRGWIIEIMAGHLIGFACCYVFLRYLGASARASLLGASVYAFGAEGPFRSAIPALMWSYALLPAVLWASARFIEGRPRAFPLLLIVVALVLLTGHPVIIIYTGMVTLGFIAFLMVRMLPKERHLTRPCVRLLSLVGVVALAALIAAPQLLPMCQQLPFSARTGPAGESLDALQNTLHIEPCWIPLSLFPTPADPTDWRHWSVMMRFPCYALFLALVGLLPGTQGRHRWYLTALGAFAVLMAMGPYVGLWKLVHSFPVLRNFRFPLRWLVFLPLCVSSLASLGLDRLIQPRPEASPLPFRWVLRSLLVGGIAAELACIFVRPDMFGRPALEAWHSRPWLTGVLWLSAVGMGAAAFLSTQCRTRRRAALWGAALIPVSLFATHVFCLSDPSAVANLKTIGWRPKGLPAAPQQYRMASGLNPYALWRAHTIGPNCRHTANLSVLEGCRITGSYCSFIPYWAMNMSSWCQEALSGGNAHGKILDVCSAKWLVERCPLSPGPPPAETERRDAETKERVNPTAIPRAHIVCSCVCCTDDTELIETIESSTFDPRCTVALLASGETTCSPLLDSDVATDDAPLPAPTIVLDRPDRVEIEITPQAPTGSFLVLSDTYYPGWKVFVDDVERDLLRANYAFRAVMLPEGANRVVFAFDPLIPDVVLPLPTIILGLLTLGTACVLRRREGSADERPAQGGRLTS